MRLLKIVVFCFVEYNYGESAPFEHTLFSEKLLIMFWKVNYLENYLLLAIEIKYAYNQLIFTVLLLFIIIWAPVNAPCLGVMFDTALCVVHVSGAVLNK